MLLLLVFHFIIVPSLHLSAIAIPFVSQSPSSHGNLSSTKKTLSSGITSLSNVAPPSLQTTKAQWPTTSSDIRPHPDSDPPGDQCWSSWLGFWSTTKAIGYSMTTYSLTMSGSGVETVMLPSYTTIQVPSVVVQGIGNFATKTLTTTVAEEQPVLTVVTHSPDWVSEGAQWMTATITPPPCALPSYVPQCQKSWVQWVDDGVVFGEEPLCTQANITSSICSSVMSSWINYQRNGNGEISGKVGLQVSFQTENGTRVWPTSTTYYYWPTSSAVAPGCTVGCQSCALSGSRVKLLYWPSATEEPSTPRTMIFDSTTLTSPTVYISFDRLHASNSCRVVGSTLSNIIVPITNSATLSSLWGSDRYWGLQQTASFNFTDLYMTPVPESIYERQPRCASSSVNIWYNTCIPSGAGGGPLCNDMRNNNYTCIRTLPYEPVLAIPLEVRHLQPEWDSCVGGVHGVYDPPTALHAAASMAVPTDPPGVISPLTQVTQQSKVTTMMAAQPSPAQQSAAPVTQSTTEQDQSGAPPVATSSRSILSHSSSEGPAVQVDTSVNHSDVPPSTTLVEQQPASSSPDNPSQPGISLFPGIQPSLSSDSANVPSGSSSGRQETPFLPKIVTAPFLTASSLRGTPQPLPSIFTPGQEPKPTNSDGSEMTPSTLIPAESLHFTFSPLSSPAPSSSTIIIDSSQIPIPIPASSGSALVAVWTASAGDQTLSIVQQSTNIILLDKHSTVTIPANPTEPITFAGQTIQPVYDSPTATSDVIFTAGLETYTAVPHGSSLIVIGGQSGHDTILTVPLAESTAVVEGETITLPRIESETRTTAAASVESPALSTAKTVSHTENGGSTTTTTGPEASTSGTSGGAVETNTSTSSPRIFENVRAMIAGLIPCIMISIVVQWV